MTEEQLNKQAAAEYPARWLNSNRDERLTAELVTTARGGVR
jgi:hypothetical protein